MVAQRRRPPHALETSSKSPAQVRVRAGHHTPHWKQRIVRDLRPLRKYGEDSPTHQHARREEYLLKLNCPHHCEIFKARPRSYRDLPVRLAEFGTVYRYEQSGELHGLTRVRGFTQDDAHIFCTQDQVKEEVGKVIDLVLYIFKTLDFQDFVAQVSLRDPVNPSKYIGAELDQPKPRSGRGKGTRDGGGIG